MWGNVLGPIGLVSSSALVGLLGAALLDLRHQRLWWTAFMIPFALLSMLIAVVSDVAAYRYLAMGLVLQPISLWVWLSVLRPASASIPQWGLAVTLLPGVWIASCGIGFVGIVNERIARLESLPAPADAEMVYKDATFVNICCEQLEASITYRVPRRPHLVISELYELYVAEGWVANVTDSESYPQSSGFIALKDYCVGVSVDWWPPGDEFLANENSLVRMRVVYVHTCTVWVEAGTFDDTGPG